MDPQKTHTPSIKEVYNATVKSLKNHPILFAPFIIFFLFDFLALSVLYLAPRMPLKLIFGPVIRTLWSERFLHYPLNFFLLPKLTSLARMALSVLFGSLLTAMAVAIVFDIYHKKHLKLAASFKFALKRYIDLFIIVFIFTILFYVAQKIISAGLFRYFMSGHTKLLFLGPRLWLGPFLLCLNFILAILIQSVFIYAIPILLIEKEKLLKSILKSFVLFKKLFIPTLILVGLPMLAYVPIVILSYNPAFLMDRLFPEIILWVLFLGSVISALVIDPLVTVSAAWLYLINRDNSNKLLKVS